MISTGISSVQNMELSITPRSKCVNKYTGKHICYYSSCWDWINSSKKVKGTVIDKGYIPKYKHQILYLIEST